MTEEKPERICKDCGGPIAADLRPELEYCEACIKACIKIQVSYSESDKVTRVDTYRLPGTNGHE